MHQHLLVPIDDAAPSRREMEEAVRLAAALQAVLHLLHVIDPFPRTAEFASVPEVEQIWSRLRTQASRQGVRTNTSIREARQSSHAALIAAEARRQRCDLIVMGTHGRRGWNRFAQGSITELLLRISPVPLLVVRGPVPGRARRSDGAAPCP